jgi:hypothetical protein
MSCRGLRHVCCDLAVGGLVEVSAWGQQPPLVGIRCPVTAAEQARYERPDSESARLRKKVSTHRPATCRAVFRPRAHASVQPLQSQPVYASTDVIMMRLNRRELDGRAIFQQGTHKKRQRLVVFSLAHVAALAESERLFQAHQFQHPLLINKTVPVDTHSKR